MEVKFTEIKDKCVEKKRDEEQFYVLHSKSRIRLQGGIMMASLGSQHTSRGKITALTGSQRDKRNE